MATTVVVTTTNTNTIVEVSTSCLIGDSLLEISGVNARYLVDQNGDPVYLAGFHTWGNVQDGDESDPPVAFDWDAYLAALLSYGCNFTELWCHEMEQGWSDTDGVYFKPNRYERNGPGNGYDSKLKYDVTKINQTYLDRLRARAIDCMNNGIYVGVMLFDGWCVGSKGLGGHPFLYHPYETANNINSLDGDTGDDGEGYEVQFHTGNNALSYEDDMVEAIIDTVNDLPNVIYVVSNESTGSTQNNDWQNHIIDLIHTYEAGKALQHLVVMGWQYPSGDNANLDASNADVICYGANDSAPLTDPFTPGASTCNMFDTDHTGGLTSLYKWIWMSMCRGNAGAWYMDEWDGEAYGSDTRANSTYILIRDNLGYALTLANMLNDLEGMTSQASLSSSGYCLAKDHATAAEYICYYDGSSTFTLDLTTATGTLNIRWLRTSDGTVQDSATVSGGAIRTLTPPWTGAVVAYVRHL